MKKVIKKIIEKLIGEKNTFILKNKLFPLKAIPNEMIIDISGTCNAKCSFCARNYMPNDRKKGFMSEETFRLCIEEAKQAGIKKIRLYSTGEPLLHPQFDLFIKLLKSEFFFIVISTNASLLDKHLESVSLIDIVQFSVEGWDPESYEELRRPLKFSKIYNNILQFNDFLNKNDTPRPKRMIHLLLTKQTELRKYINLWKDLIDEIRVDICYPTNIFKNDFFVSIIPDSLQNKLLDFEEIKGLKICQYPFEVITVSWDGKISLCCLDFAANLELGYMSSGIRNIYYSANFNKIRNEFRTQNLRTCKKCMIFKMISTDDKNKIKNSLLELTKEDVSLKDKIHCDFISLK